MKQHIKTENNRQRTSLHTYNSPRHTKGLPTNTST